MQAAWSLVMLVAVAATSGCKDKPADVVATKPAEPRVDTVAARPADTAAARPPTTPAADGWTTYSSPEGTYSIEFPTPPKVKGMLVVAEFGVTDKDSRTSACGIAASPLPGDESQAATMLDAMATGYKTDATVIEEKDITIGKYAGKSLVIQTERHRKSFRLYVIKDKLYINNCGGPFDRADADAPTAKRVLDSFKPAI
jgi:hypothetical protein